MGGNFPRTVKILFVIPKTKQEIVSKDKDLIIFNNYVTSKRVNEMGKTTRKTAVWYTTKK